MIRNSSSFPVLMPGTGCGTPLAEALIGSDLSGPPSNGGGDIIVFLNSSIDEECLAPGTGFYYGLDGNAPANQIELSIVMLHELAHGLGMANFHNESSGLFPLDTPSIYDLFTLDKTTGQTWDEMTAWERVISAANDRNVVWSGPEANSAAQATLQPGVVKLSITAPATIAGEYQVGTAGFGPQVNEFGVSGEIVCAFSSDTLSGSEVCDPIRNVDDVAGRIAIIDRGTCLFTERVKHVQDAGAIGVIIVNYDESALTLGGDDPTIAIPAVSVGASDGALIRSAACAHQSRAYGIPAVSPIGAFASIFILGLAASLLLRRRLG